MTQPATLGRPADQDQLDEQSRVWEDALVAAATAALLADLVAAFARAHALVAGGIPAATIRAALVAALRGAQVDIARPVLERIQEGVELGADQALATAPDLPAGFGPEVAADVDLDADMETAIRALDRQVRDGLDRAVTLAETLPLDTAGDVATVQAVATKPANAAAAEVSWWANQAVNAGTAAVAETTGAELLWIAERDACLTCLALSGETVQPGEEFDVSLTFDAHPMPMFPIASPAPLLYPPRHPHCRCRVRVWWPVDVPGGVSMPEVLRREAERSVARGFSNHHPRGARLSAAGRLLVAANRSSLSTTALRRSRRDIARGAFSPRHNERLPGLPPGRR